MIIVISSSLNKKKIIRLYKKIEDDLENLVREKSKFFQIPHLNLYKTKNYD